MRYDTENEQPYIDGEKPFDRAEAQRAQKLNDLWFELGDEESASNLSHRYSDPYDVAGKLLSIIAKAKSVEDAGMCNLSLSYDIRKAQRTSDREALVRDLQNAVEALFSEAV